MTFLRLIPPIPLACFHHVLFDLNSANNQIDRSLSYGSVRFGSCDLSWENYQVPNKSDAKRERERAKKHRKRNVIGESIVIHVIFARTLNKSKKMVCAQRRNEEIYVSGHQNMLKFLSFLLCLHCFSFLRRNATR